MNLKFYFVAAMIFILSGCNYNVQKKSDEPQTELLFSTGREISYQNVHDLVIAPACISCHSHNGSRGRNKGGVNLENYANVFFNRNKIHSSVSDGSMPDDSPALTDYQKRLIISWIEAGASEFAQDNSQNPNKPPPVVTQPPTPPVEPPPDEPIPPVEPQPVEPITPVEPPVTPVDPPPTDTPVNPPANPPASPNAGELTFAFVSEKVLKTNCTKCHSDEGGNRGDVNLETYGDTFMARDDIRKDVMKGKMPPKSPKGIPLTDEQKRILFAWLDAGAPE